MMKKLSLLVAGGVLALLTACTPAQFNSYTNVSAEGWASSIGSELVIPVDTVAELNTLYGFGQDEFVAYVWSNFFMVSWDNNQSLEHLEFKVEDNGDYRFSYLHEDYELNTIQGNSMGTRIGLWDLQEDTITVSVDMVLAVTNIESFLETAPNGIQIEDMFSSYTVEVFMPGSILEHSHGTVTSENSVSVSLSDIKQALEESQVLDEDGFNAAPPFVLITSDKTMADATAPETEISPWVWIVGGGVILVGVSVGASVLITRTVVKKKQS